MSDFTWARLRFSSGSVITLSGPRFLWALKTSPDQSRYLVPQTLRPSSFFPHIAPSRSGEPLALKNAQASCFFGAAWVRSVSIRTSERWSFHVFFDSEESVIWRGEHIQYALQRIFKDTQVWSAHGCRLMNGVTARRCGLQWCS